MNIKKEKRTSVSKVVTKWSVGLYGLGLVLFSVIWIVKDRNLNSVVSSTIPLFLGCYFFYSFRAVDLANKKKLEISYVLSRFLIVFTAAFSMLMFIFAVIFSGWNVGFSLILGFFVLLFVFFPVLFTYKMVSKGLLIR